MLCFRLPINFMIRVSQGGLRDCTGSATVLVDRNSVVGYGSRVSSVSLLSASW